MKIQFKLVCSLLLLINESINLGGAQNIISVVYLLMTGYGNVENQPFQECVFWL